MKHLPRLFLALTSCGYLTLACTSDDRASVYLPDEPIAVGAYFPLNVRDACSGGGKINFCSSENVVSIDEISVDDPRVADVMRMEALTEGLRLASAELVISGKRAGTTEVLLDTTFDDGSSRQVSTSIDIATPDSMELVHNCTVSDPDDFDLFPTDTDVALTVDLLYRGTPLRGEHQTPLIAGQGVHQVRGWLERNAYSWTSPKKSGTTRISSPLFQGFSAKYRAFAPSSLKIDSIEPKYDLKTSYETFITFSVALTVDKKKPCVLPPLELETLTPAICGGPEGAAKWTVKTPEYGISIRALNSGECSFVVSIPGTSTTYPVKANIEVTDVPPVYVDPCQDVQCEAPPSPCPSGTELVKEQCCNACVPLGNPALCETERTPWDALYATELPKATSCSVDIDCAPVVLVGGCRRYCFVALNTQNTATFMNAISPTYYNECPSCRVSAPAACEGTGAVYCNNGQCAVKPSP